MFVYLYASVVVRSLDKACYDMCHTLLYILSHSIEKSRGIIKLTLNTYSFPYFFRMNFTSMYYNYIYTRPKHLQ